MSNDRWTWIIGLDPGLSTGLFVVRVEDSGNPVLVLGRYQGQHAPILARLEECVRNAALWQERVLIAAERFTTTQQTGKRSAQPLPQRILGAAEQLTYSYTNVEFILQTPADAKRLADNQLLRDTGFWSTGDDVGCHDANDVNDAARHVLLLMAKRCASKFDWLMQQVEAKRQGSQR